MRSGGWFASPRERALWIWSVAATLAIYVSLYWVRIPVEWLRERNLLRLSVAAIFLVTAVAIVVVLARRRPGRREIAVLAGCAIVYLVALLVTERHEERLHFLEYGLVAGLIYAALLERRRHGRLPPAVAPYLAVVLTGLAGWADEGIQGLLPNRVYELRDAGLNLAAAILAVASMAALAAARRADRR